MYSIGMMKHFFLATMPALVAGCIGPMGDVNSSPVDLGGYIGRTESRPADVSGALGSASSIPNFDDVPLCCRRDLNAYGDDQKK